MKQISTSKLISSKKFLLLALFIGLSNFLMGQILDDTTRLVYGPHTTRYLFEEQVRENDSTYFRLDTLLTSFYKFDFVQQYQNKYQNLGNVGTASRYIFYTPPDVIGMHPGFNAFDLYFTPSEQVKYFDTRSPYAKLDVVFGGNRRSIINTAFSRNVNPRWNLGGDFRVITADKQLAPTRSNGDRQTVNMRYDIYTRFRTKNERYQVLANFTGMTHRNSEQGGIDSLQSGGWFNYEESSVRLNNAESRDKRMSFNVYQQFTLNKIMQLYHASSWSRQINEFEAYKSTGDSFENFFTHADTTYDRNTYKLWKHELGIKGNFTSALFYSAGLEAKLGRFHTVDSVSLRDTTLVANEIYVNGKLRYQLKKAIRLDVDAQYLIGHTYSLKGVLSSRWVDVSYHTLSYRPAFMHQFYRSNYHQWSNNFSPTFADHLEGRIKLIFPNIKLNPNITFSRITRPIYFDTARIVQQSNNTAILITPAFEFELTFLKYIHFYSNFLYTLASGKAQDVFPVPSFFINTSLYYQRPLFKGKLYFMGGTDLHWKSAYYAPGYDPAIQQFYIQDDFLVAPYPVLDLYVSIKISKARVFAKFIHVNQPIDGGYFVTPYYTAQRRVFDLGVSWMFFD